MPGSMVRRLDRVVVRDSVQEVNVQVSADLQLRSDAGMLRGIGEAVYSSRHSHQGDRHQVAQLLSPQLYRNSHETPMSCSLTPSDVPALGQHHPTSTQ